MFYELLTGKRLFQGDGVAGTLTQVLTKQPDLEKVPVEARPLLRECLQKEPQNRLRDIGDAKRMLPTEARADGRSPRKMPWVWAAWAALATLAAAGLAIVHFREVSPEKSVVRFQLDAPEKTASTTFLTLSPDGKRLAFLANGDDGVLRVWIRSLDGLDAQPLPGTENASLPFWSPDSRFVAFWAGATLMKVNVSGGPPQEIGLAVGGGGGTWNHDGIIAFGSPQGVRRISQAGGQVTPVTTPAPGETVNANPHFLPDGKHFLFSADGPEGGVYLATLDGPDRRRLVAGKTSAEYSPGIDPKGPGYLLFVQGTTLMAQHFDLEKLDLEGEAVPVAEQVSSAFGGWLAMFSVSSNGVLAWTGAPPVRNQLVWFDRGGTSQGTLGPPGPYSDVTLSPDGKQAAVSFSMASGRADVFVMDLTQGVPSRLTFDDARHTRPIWSPDARWLAFSSDRGAAWGMYNVYRRDASGGGEDQLLLKPGMIQTADDVSSDGKLLVYDSQDPKTGSDLWVVPVGADAKAAPYLSTAANESGGRFAPNGANSPRWVAYVSNESGKNEVYVQSYPPGGEKHQVSSDGGHGPRWSKNGDELFYLTSAGDLMAVQVKAGEKFEIGRSETLFRVHGPVGSDPGNSLGYDVSPDGKRFLIMIPSSAQVGSLPFHVVLNWQAGLRK